MKISYNWLKQYINLKLGPEKISELLTNLGLEVEGVQKYSSIKGGLEGIVVGHVKDCTKHPNADKLKITSVDIGSNKLLKIVCGAPNVDKGQKVAVATVGTTIYSSNGSFAYFVFNFSSSKLSRKLNIPSCNAGGIDVPP